MTDQPNTSVVLTKPKIWRFIPEIVLILLILVCLSARILPTSANHQRRAVESLEQHGWYVGYDYQKMVGQPAPPLPGITWEVDQYLPGYSFRVRPPGPAPLRWLLGKHYFISAVYVRVGRTSDNCLARLADLPDIEHAEFDVGVGSELASFKQLRKLRHLSLKRYTVPDTDHSPYWVLEELPSLETLDLEKAQFGDDDAKYLQDAPRLKRLILTNTAIGDEGLAYLQNLNSLEVLDLGATRVTDRGITHLSRLPKLTTLRLNHTEVSDSSSESFMKMTSLRELSLYEAKVEGINRLRRALPYCEIIYKKRKSLVGADAEVP